MRLAVRNSELTGKDRAAVPFAQFAAAIQNFYSHTGSRIPRDREGVHVHAMFLMLGVGYFPAERCDLGMVVGVRPWHGATTAKRGEHRLPAPLSTYGYVSLLWGSRGQLERGLGAFATRRGDLDDSISPDTERISAQGVEAEDKASLTHR
jgi:hypothetical protein